MHHGAARPLGTPGALRDYLTARVMGLEYTLLPSPPLEQGCGGAPLTKGWRRGKVL